MGVPAMCFVNHGSQCYEMHASMALQIQPGFTVHVSKAQLLLQQVKPKWWPYMTAHITCSRSMTWSCSSKPSHRRSCVPCNTFTLHHVYKQKHYNIVHAGITLACRHKFTALRYNTSSLQKSWLVLLYTSEDGVGAGRTGQLARSRTTRVLLNSK